MNGFEDNSHNGFLWSSYLKQSLASVLNFSMPNTHRWVVLHFIKSGCNPKENRVVSIGASVVKFTLSRKPFQDLSDTFEVTFQSNRPSVTLTEKQIILEHGVGKQAQCNGLNAKAAMLQLIDYIGDSPILSFNGELDKQILKQTCGESFDFRHELKHWLSISHLASTLHNETHLLSFEVWLQRYGLIAEMRHDALYDSIMTVQLLLKLWPLFEKHGATVWRTVKKLESQPKSKSARYD